MAVNGNNANNGNVNPPLLPQQPHAQQWNAIIQAPVAQHDPTLTWLSDLPEPRRGVDVAVIWPKVTTVTAPKIATRVHSPEVHSIEEDVPDNS